MKTSPSSAVATLVAAASLTLAIHASAATASFTGAVDNEYLTAGNWSGSAVPNTANGDTAIIANGSAVDYNPGGDLTISNGGTLQVTNGSWTQSVGPAWIQLGQGGATGNGHILVNGGTFNQGTAGNNPFNITGTGNTFTITSGAANFNTQVNAVAGMTWTIGGGATSMAAGPIDVQNGGKILITAGTLVIGGNVILENGSTWSQTGGVVTLAAGAEFQYSSLTNSSMSGGILNVTRLLTGVNGPLGSTFNFSGGIINDGATGFAGWYGADNADHPFNFTLGSTGIINFLNGNTTVGDVAGWLIAGGIQYNNTIDPSAFNVTQNGNTVTLALVVPEPSTYACLLGGLGACVVLYRRRRPLL